MTVLENAVHAGDDSTDRLATEKAGPSAVAVDVYLSPTLCVDHAMCTVGGCGVACEARDPPSSV